VVAPYWSDNDIRRDGNVSYEVFQLQATGAYGDMLLDYVSSYIRACRNTSSDFRGSFMILAEWRGVHPYPHGSNDAADNDPFLSQVNDAIDVILIIYVCHIDQHLPSSCDYRLGRILCDLYI